LTSNQDEKQMKQLAALIFAFISAASCWAEPSTPDGSYKQPYPHSRGAELLAHCEQTDVLVSQLRCDYYVQGVADLATIPQEGKPLACIPQGQNRTQLMQVAVDFLKKRAPEKLEKESAARLILNAFIAAFPCPKNMGAAALSAEELEAVKKSMIEANKKPKAGTLSAEELEAVKKGMLEAQKKAKAEVPD
jgi:hypothetical protein